MFVTALVDLPPFGPDAARRLSAASGLPLRFAGERLQVPRRGPTVIRCFDDAAAAHGQLAILTAAGFQGFVVGPPWPQAAHARQLVVVGDDLMVLFEGGHRQIFAGQRVPLVVWGTRILPVGTVVERPAAEAAEGPRQRRLPVEAREGFLRLFPDTGPIIRVDSSVVAGLDDHAFDLLVKAVRRVCPPQALDDRLLAQRTQAQILGHELWPDTHLDLAVVLVARARGWHDPQ